MNVEKRIPKINIGLATDCTSYPQKSSLDSCKPIHQDFHAV